METVKCKECGKELSKKAEICPNCGIRVKRKSLLAQIGVFFLGIILLIAIIAIIIGIVIFIGKTKKDAIKEKYAGTWMLQTEQDVYYTIERTDYTTNEKTYTKKKIILDKELEVKKENISYGMMMRSCTNKEHFVNGKLLARCPDLETQIFLSEMYDDIFGIGFLNENGYPIILCFKYKDNRIEQISAENIATNKFNPNGYSLNGGIDETLGIIYTKK
ncbi:MAG: zinc ribbon domain-containing protein [Clostridia bacterium]|nr:zinc ribbon domain-containing protein [Clostridia bacterium]